MQQIDMPDLALLVTQVLLASIPLVGPVASTILVSPSYQNVLAAFDEALSELRFALEDDTRNALLTYCRIWYTLEQKVIGSKLEAARWVQGELPGYYAEAIEHAQAILKEELEDDWSGWGERVNLCANHMDRKVVEKIADERQCITQKALASNLLIIKK